jgi:hypothetical protein
VTVNVEEEVAAQMQWWWASRRISALSDRVRVRTVGIVAAANLIS